MWRSVIASTHRTTGYRLPTTGLRSQVGCREILPPDAEHEMYARGSVARRALDRLQKLAADLLHRLLRAQIRLADHEYHPLHKAKRVLQHQPLHLPVVGSTPVRPFQEGEADLHLARLEVVIARAADDSARLPFDHRERAPGLDGAVEIPLENFPRVAVALRMLLPDERVAGRRKQRRKVFAPQRT